MRTKTIALDLDGVLAQFDGGWTDPHSIGMPAPGIREFLTKLAEDYRLIVFTTRSSFAAVDWLCKWSLIDFFDEVRGDKPTYHLMIDDRALEYFGSFTSTLEEIQSYRPYWEK
jgi:hypothetical protein